MAARFNDYDAVIDAFLLSVLQSYFYLWQESTRFCLCWSACLSAHYSKTLLAYFQEIFEKVRPRDKTNSVSFWRRSGHRSGFISNDVVPFFNIGKVSCRCALELTAKGKSRHHRACVAVQKATTGNPIMALTWSALAQVYTLWVLSRLWLFRICTSVRVHTKYWLQIPYFYPAHQRNGEVG